MENREIIDWNTHLNFHCFSMLFCIDFWWIFDPNLPPKIHQNRSKIDAKMPSHVELLFWSIFDRFLLPTWTPRTQFGASGLAFSWFFRFRGNIDLGSEFGANMAPFSFPKSFQNLPKIDPKRHQFFDRFLHRFLFPFWLHLGTQVGVMLATLSNKMGQQIR